MAEKRIETEKRSGTLYERIDIHGNTVLTNLSLITFLDWYKTIKAMYPDVIINHTNAGLLN